ncbi:MAG: C-type lectin domain-containing protein, partial [Deltaproteobacteria bacterium]|nr:C-type lectin domain-containing protein [Deltaproteobacteria bacterium]
FGAYLVSVGDADEQEAVVAWLAGRSWLGLTRQGSCEWHWVNGEPFGAGQWEIGQPSSGCGGQDCAAFWNDPLYRWDDYDCERPAAFVCEWDA